MILKQRNDIMRKSEETKKTKGNYLWLTAALIILSYGLFAQNQSTEWTVRYNRTEAQQAFEVTTKTDGFTVKSGKVDAQGLYVYCHLPLERPIQSLTFKYTPATDVSQLPITLLDAAANVLWKFDGSGTPPKTVELQNLKVRGQLVFRIGKNEGDQVVEGLSHTISDIKIIEDKRKPILDTDGFILVDNMTEFRGYASEDNVKIRLKPGPYKIDKAYCTRFVEFSGNNCLYDLDGVSIMIDTKLFANKSLARGNSEKSLYCAFEISGSHSTMEGPYIETYGNYYGHQSKNKMFNLVGLDVTLKNAEVRTSGSNPWGYGSFYGLGGNDVRKMNGIRIGYPADGVKLIGCKVHMRAMGHAIFVQ